MAVTCRTDVLVIGAGPAGLAAAACCRARGHDYLVVEMGSRAGQRDHTNQRGLGTGVGGSGLYSDGKFSFFPSASALWKLSDAQALDESWRWFSAVVAPLGLVVPPLPVPASLLVTVPAAAGNDLFRQKEYDSVYVSLERRRRLVEELEGQCGSSLLAGVELRSVRSSPDTRLFRCEVRSDSSLALDEVEARAIVFVGGRFGTVGWAATFPEIPQVFRRVEVGVRIEQESEGFFLKDDRFRDPKLILSSRNGRYSWRTFCCCRDGEVVSTEVRGVVSVSGRADGPTTGMPCRPTSEQLRQFLVAAGSGDIAQVLGRGAAALLAEGLQELCVRYPRLRESPARLVAPAIEGVGQYPELTGTLRAGPHPLWVAGDATGIFRGLTAALVSGYFAAAQAAAYSEASQ